MGEEKGQAYLMVLSENKQMKEVLEAFREYDEAMSRLDVCAYKYDQGKVVEKKKKEFYAKYSSLNFLRREKK